MLTLRPPRPSAAGLQLKVTLEGTVTLRQG
jgi:hypothetical protein